ncbi:MAG: chemotaxis protein CheX [Spirochaetota bacterium]
MRDLSRKYEKALVRSVLHIFNNFFSDETAEEAYQTQSSSSGDHVWIEIAGSFSGEIVISLPHDTLVNLIRIFHPRSQEKTLMKHKNDVIGEMANLITGTFANQLQYLNHDIRLSPPEFDEEPIQMKALYHNINCSFMTTYGGFDVDLYYKEK